MKIGIGITTRNRPDILNICLDHFHSFNNYGNHYDIIVNDDNSDEESHFLNRDICEKYNVYYNYNCHREGIAASKNNCIKFLIESDYIFLFDDDCFPKKSGWENYYISISQKMNVHHMLWAHPNVPDHLQLIKTVDSINEFSNCMGVMLFFSKYAIDKLGGFDPRFGLYGYEHAQLSQRASKAGLTGNFGPYIAPINCHNYIYSMDMNYQWLLEDIPLSKNNYEFVWRSSIANEDRNALITINNKIYTSDYKIKVDI